MWPFNEPKQVRFRSSAAGVESLPTYPEMHLMTIETRRFFATSTHLRSPSGAWPLAAVAMLMLGTLATPSFGGTDVIGGSTTFLNGPSDIIDPLSFLADPGGSGDPAVLELGSSGTYTGNWSVNNVFAIFLFDLPQLSVLTDS